MSEVGYCHLNKETGDNANNGLTEDTPVKDFATAFTKGDKIVTVIVGGTGSTDENLNNFPSNKQINILGSSLGGSLRTVIAGNGSNSDPIIYMNHQNSCARFSGIDIGSSVDGKICVDIDPGSNMQMYVLSFDEVCFFMPQTRQIGIRYGNIGFPYFTFNKCSFFPYGLSDPTGVYEIYSSRTEETAQPILFRDCTFIFTDIFPESQIFGKSGSIDGCKFYNCLWVEINFSTGEMTIHTEPNTYPSGANAENRDPNPQQTSEWWRLQLASGGSSDALRESLFLEQNAKLLNAILRGKNG